MSYNQGLIKKLEAKELMSKESLEFSVRLHEALDDFGMPREGRQTKTGEVFNVSQRGAGYWLSGEGFPQMEKTIEIADRLKVNLDWLVRGRGPKNDFLRSTKEDQIFMTIYECLELALKKDIWSHTAKLLEDEEKKEKAKPKAEDLRSLFK